MAQNVDVKVEGTTLVLKVDLTKSLGPSKSGKTTIVGTTAGNLPVPDGAGATVTVGLNVYRAR